MAKGKLLWVTGIAGCRRKEYLSNWQEYCEKKGKKVKIYHVGQMMFPWAKEYCNLELDKRYVLNTPEHTLGSIRGGVFESILGGSERDRLNRELEEYDAIVISVHNRYLWKTMLDRAYNVSFLRRFDPDVFVCFIDPSEIILDRLNSREQWQGQKLTEDDILWWQEVEVDDTKSFPEWLGIDKKWLVLPTQQLPSLLYFQIFEPWRPLMYAQMPISHIKENKEEKLAKVQRFIERLSKDFPVLNPLLIETGNVIPGEKTKKKDGQTVKRDNKWFIAASKITIANIIELVYSAGVPDEMREAQDTNKESWAIFPGDCSPFFEQRVTDDRIFQNNKDFFRFIDEEFKPYLIKRWEKEHGERVSF